MAENKEKTEIELLSQNETELEEIETDPTDETEREMNSSGQYLDEICNKTKKLSGIIACLGGIPRESRDDDDFTNLSWAMEEFTDKILKLVDGLWDHLSNIGALSI